MNCKYYRTRTKNYKKIGYCTRYKKEVALFCKECENIEYKKVQKRIKGHKHKLTKATEIPKKVKLQVWERDEHRCIFCKTPVEWNYANSHYIKRSHSGLGINPKNIMTNCDRCHRLFEESIYRKQMQEYAKNYFKEHYSNWNESDLIYKKY